jgi:hypothetical protein
VRSWPAGLGFAAETPARGLCIGSGWPAHESNLASLATTGRTGFARVYDRAGDCAVLFAELFAPRRASGGRALGRGPEIRVPHWLDLQLDRPEVGDWINDRGIALTRIDTRPCHWGFYTRNGAFGIYQAILRRRPGWDIATLSRVSDLGRQEPRWSRLRPELALSWRARAPAIELESEPTPRLIPRNEPLPAMLTNDAGQRGSR